MKFKEKRGNTFVFDGGYDLGELELLKLINGFFVFKGVYYNGDLEICTFDSVVPYKDIQTAVNLMQILINEGLV